MQEVWKDVKGYEGLYQISNFGRIKTFERKKFKKTERIYPHPIFADLGEIKSLTTEYKAPNSFRAFLENLCSFNSFLSNFNDFSSP